MNGYSERNEWAHRLHSATVWAETCPGDMLASAQARLESVRRRCTAAGYAPGSLIHYSQELHGWRVTPESGQPRTVGAGETWFYVGSTDTHSAHAPVIPGSPLARIVSRAGYHRPITGEWAGEREESTIYAFPAMGDGAAQRIAYALAIVTGNDAVLVVRSVTVDDDTPFRSMRGFRVSTEWREDGNRSFIDDSYSQGYAYVHDIRGGNIAYLIGRDNSVSAVA